MKKLKWLEVKYGKWHSFYCLVCKFSVPWKLKNLERHVYLCRLGSIMIMSYYFGYLIFLQYEKLTNFEWLFYLWRSGEKDTVPFIFWYVTFLCHDNWHNWIKWFFMKEGKWYFLVYFFICNFSVPLSVV